MSSSASKANGNGDSLPQRDTTRLTLYFLSWKLMLLFIALASPGPGYDTSTEILFNRRDNCDVSRPWHDSLAERLALRLTRWDGIYFASSSTRGHLNEQDWAFSWALARITHVVSGVLFSPFNLSPIVKHALTGILVSHTSHLLAVLALYSLTVALIPAGMNRKRQIAFTAASLHILSPAGLFLSAPYGESAFAFLNFTGMLVYALAAKTRFANGDHFAFQEALMSITSGLLFGLASTMRSNGIFSGVLFAWDAIDAISSPLQLLHDFNKTKRFVATILPGILVGIGFAIPQVVAYMEYCTSGNTRPWCDRVPPSIYSWVQSHYWGVGLFRYWTLSNLPLFLIASPVLVLLLFTAVIAIWQPQNIAATCQPSATPSKSRNMHESAQIDTKLFDYCLPRLALPQLILAVMAATSFHVQIINRISSGYPIWYILLAISIQSSARMQGALTSTTPDDRNDRRSNLPAVESANSRSMRLLTGRHIGWIVRGMIMYAIIQGGLYASFLPPA